MVTHPGFVLLFIFSLEDIERHMSVGASSFLVPVRELGVLPNASVIPFRWEEREEEGPGSSQ